MIVLEEQKVLVLEHQNAMGLAGCIPDAKATRIRDRNYVVMPHGVKQVAHLRAMQFSAPSPILSQYYWPSDGSIIPGEHQKLTAAFITENIYNIVTNDIGTGKTLSALWAMDYLMDVGEISRVLIVSPLSTLDLVWGKTLFTHFPHLDFKILHGAKEKRLRLLQDRECGVFVINHDGIKTVMKDKNFDFDMIIYDEAAVMRNNNTSRFKDMKDFAYNNPHMRLCLMTGTPCVNAPTDVWTLMRLIRSPECPKYFTEFRSIVMKKKDQYKYEPRDNAMQIVAKVFKPAIRFTREQCADLPDTTYQERRTPLSKEQSEAYESMLKVFAAEHASGKITAANAAVKVQKLLQICCGCVYNDHGDPSLFECPDRVKVLKDTLQEIGGKVIVFAPYISVLYLLLEELTNDYKVGLVCGEVPAARRTQIFNGFQEGDEFDIILAQPSTMAHGLTLTAAKAIVWYAPIYSNEIYTQANGRVERIGKRHSTTVVHMLSTALEDKVYRKLQTKQNMQGILLDILEDKTGKDGR
jgi:SNF2 family DNA or RNA helicase